MKLKEYLKDEITSIFNSWCDDGIYAISFLLTSNELSTYKGINNFPEFSVGYNTEQECEGADELSEERWNYALWKQNNVLIISPDNDDSAKLLLDWYNENGIENIGNPENENDSYNEKGEYIGKGPVGYYELITLISDIAKEFQTSGAVYNKFGKIPIIVHDLEYSWLTRVLTSNANPNEEATNFLKYLSLNE